MKNQNTGNVRANLLARLQEVALQTDGPAVSIIMPTAVAIPEKLQNHILLKDCIKEAVNKLLKSFPEREIEELLARLETLYKEHDFASASHSLALFANRSFGTVLNLPFTRTAMTVVADKFQVVELQAAVEQLSSYWLLELHQDICRLYRGFGHTLEEVVTPLTDAQGNALQGFPLDHPKPQLAEADRRYTGKGEKETEFFKKHFRTFFHVVDHELDKKLHEERLPIVVVGTVANISMFRDLTKHAATIIGYQEGSYANKHELALAAEQLLASQRS